MNALRIDSLEILHQTSFIATKPSIASLMVIVQDLELEAFQKPVVFWWLLQSVLTVLTNRVVSSWGVQPIRSESSIWIGFPYSCGWWIALHLRQLCYLSTHLVWNLAWPQVKFSTRLVGTSCFHAVGVRIVCSRCYHFLPSVQFVQLGSAHLCQSNAVEQ